MKLRNFKAIISYDGRAYYGFQKQKEKASVQGELERALSFLFGYEETTFPADQQVKSYRIDTK